MSFPQPNADEYAVAGSKFFRLNTLISTAGDIYESAQGAMAFALGPESDISKVNIVYYDPQVTTFVQRTQISPSRAFSGEIVARNTDTYQPSNRPGRILLYPDELFPNDYLPPTFGVGDLIQFVRPRLDVIQFFTPQSSVASARNDKVLSFQTLPFPAGDFFLLVPAYGRRYAFIEFTNFSTTDVTVTYTGVNFAITDDAAPTPTHQETTLQAPALVTMAGGQLTVRYNASVNGMFDAYVLQFDGTSGPTPTRIILSDTEG